MTNVDVSNVCLRKVSIIRENENYTYPDVPYLGLAVELEVSQLARGLH